MFYFQPKIQKIKELYFTELNDPRNNNWQQALLVVAKAYFPNAYKQLSGDTNILNEELDNKFYSVNSKKQAAEVLKIFEMIEKRNLIEKYHIIFPSMDRDPEIYEQNGQHYDRGTYDPSDWRTYACMIGHDQYAWNYVPTSDKDHQIAWQEGDQLPPELKQAFESYETNRISFAKHLHSPDTLIAFADPDRQTGRFLTRQEAKKYEKVLKADLTKWMNEAMDWGLFDASSTKVYDDLNFFTKEKNIKSYKKLNKDIRKLKLFAEVFRQQMYLTDVRLFDTPEAIEHPVLIPADTNNFVQFYDILSPVNLTKEKYDPYHPYVVNLATAQNFDQMLKAYVEFCKKAGNDQTMKATALFYANNILMYQGHCTIKPVVKYFNAKKYSSKDLQNFYDETRSNSIKLQTPKYLQYKKELAVIGKQFDQWLKDTFNKTSDLLEKVK